MVDKRALAFLTALDAKDQRVIKEKLKILPGMHVAVGISRTKGIALLCNLILQPHVAPGVSEWCQRDSPFSPRMCHGAR
jgi:hypothetical protein